MTPELIQKMNQPKEVRKGKKKIYLSKYQRHKIWKTHPITVVMMNGQRANIRGECVDFLPDVRPGMGVFETDDLELQAFVESTAAYKTGEIAEDAAGMRFTAEGIKDLNEKAKTAGKTAYAGIISCSKCGKVYKQPSSLGKHKKKCKGKLEE